ncbi:MAG: DNA internalization-related competence protein ComEC/Rec2 [Betaproteobacteria bacterium]
MRFYILAFATGIAGLQFQADLPGAIPGWILAGIVLVVMSLPLRQPAIRRPLALLGCLLLGFGFAAWRAEIRLADQLPPVWEGRDVELVGVIAELPQGFSQGSRFRFAVEQVLTPAAVVPSSVMLSWYNGRRDGENFEGRIVRPGERWRLTVRLKRPHGNANPHGFDYEAWLLENDIRATGYVRPGETAELMSPMVWSAGNVIHRLRGAVRDSFERMLPEATHPYSGVLLALAIGDQRAIHGDLWNTFNRTGVTHLMSISGLHVTMIAALAAALTAWGWRRVPALALRLPTRRAAIVAGVLTALFYAFIAGFGVPAQRTVYMLAVAALALYSGRSVAASRVLCLALQVVLLVDPWAVLAAGFWLSFGAVGALLLIGSARVGGGEGWRERIYQWGAVQWAATLASLPVLLLVFQQFSLVSPLANAVAIPVVSFVITPLALAAAVIPWWPLLEAAHGVLAVLMHFLEWCATWPVWQAPAPPLWVAAAGGIGVALMLLPRGVPGRWAGVGLLLPAVFWPVAHPEPGEAWIDVLDVGQGLAVVVRTGEHTLLYDTGPLYSAESDAGQRVIVPYLRALGVNRIDLMMVTHRDSDHSGGIASVRAALPVGKMLSSLPEIGGEKCVAGQSWTWEGVRFDVLHPVDGDYVAGARTNHLSCVLRVAAGERAVLLTSDIEARDEAAMLARDISALKADVVLVPHHGSRTSSTPAFLAAWSAHEAIVPVGYRNRFGHPKDDVLARYAALDMNIHRTDRKGALLVRLASHGVGIDSWRDLRRRYWQDRELP